MTASAPSDASRPGGRSRLAAVALSCGLFIIMAAAFAASPVNTPTDSRWALHTAMSFAKGNGGDLTDYVTPEFSGHYAIKILQGRPRTVYPIGVSLLTAPAVALIAWYDPGFEERLRRGNPAQVEKVLASLIGALSGVALFWLIFNQFQSLWIGLATTFIFAFGTSVWSTATRALWAHGPLVLMLTIAMLVLQQARRRPAIIQYASLPLAVAYLSRPTAIIPVGVLTAYVLAFHRRWFVRYMAWAMIIAVPWIAFNFTIYNRPIPFYYRGNAFDESTVFVEGLLGNLFSPSRGLLVFSPVLLFALSGYILALRSRAERPLHLAYGAIVAGHAILIGNAAAWWAGHAFGPRFMTDITPFLAFYTAFNFRLPAALGRRAQAAVTSAIVVLGLLSAAIHAQGALRRATWAWNTVPENIDKNPARAWDWRDPQFARTEMRFTPP